MHRYKTHTCGELRPVHAGTKVKLAGWVYHKRDHGSLLFIDLRDNYDVTQIVIQPDKPFFDLCKNIRIESVISVTGVVKMRSPDTVNPKLATGEIEVVAEDVEVLSEADVLPFVVSSDDPVLEELRLKYRFLDLRRPRMHRNIILRSRVINEIRRRMIDIHGFMEFETPILTSSSPEGARDFLVPSRLHPGKFYALPQSPQQFKQLLMISGFEKYFQIAPCFRDEDARADRSPGVHYQLDIEMSFVEQEDIFRVVEDVLYHIFTKFSSFEVDPPPFKRISYKEAMTRYGSDKPDLRIPLHMVDVSDIFYNTDCMVFKNVLQRGGVIRTITVNSVADQPRSFFDKMVEFAKSVGAAGLAYIVWDSDGLKGPLMKFLKEEEIKAIESRCNISLGSAIFFIADSENKVAMIGDALIRKFADELDLRQKDVFKFCWITDFPMYEYDEKLGKITFMHNPFSMPKGGLEALCEKDPLDILAYQYDIVCNGIELGSGAVRNHKPEIMYKAFEIVGYTREEVDEKFGALARAFRYGAPPHAGIAPGIDRLVMMLTGEENIREVIAFPLNQKAQDIMMNAPSKVTEAQLKELYIKIDLPEGMKE